MTPLEGFMLGTVWGALIMWIAWRAADAWWHDHRGWWYEWQEKKNDADRPLPR